MKDLIPVRMLNELIYCERLFYLEHVQGEFAANYFTIDGDLAHKRVDSAVKELPPTAPTDPTNNKPYIARSVWLSSEQLGITGKIDVVEGISSHVTVVEYKRGAPPDIAEGAYLPERVQVCGQTQLLREHGFTVDNVEIYFAKAKRRVPIIIDASLEAITRAAVARANELLEQKQIPPPLVDSPKCNGCSLVGICLPDEVTSLRTEESLPMRQLHPARDDKQSLHVQGQGARVGLRDECLVVRQKSGEETTARLIHTSSVSVYGNVQVSTQALRELLSREIPVAFFTTGGWYCGRATGHQSGNVELHKAQIMRFGEIAVCLQLARGVVESKIKNSRTLLRRNANSTASVESVITELELLAGRATLAGSLAALLGIEGAAARLYFKVFSAMLKTQNLEFNLEGRNRRPPRDPINAVLSLAYALLAKDVAFAVENTGLDSTFGFYHQPKARRPALALDLMEEFRPLLADSTVISTINTGVITPEDFVRAAGSTALKTDARKRFIQAYERRISQEITHPVFGYRINYRRVLEVQARLLSRFLLDEIDKYPQFNTR